MSPSTDPVAFALGVLGIWLGVLAMGLVVWIGLSELLTRRQRRRAARRVTGPRYVDREPGRWEWPDRP